MSRTLMAEDLRGKTVLFLATQPLDGMADALARSLGAKVSAIPGDPGSLGEGVEALGHARRWIAAGDLYEKLLALMARGKAFDYVLCLDPWAACIQTSVSRLLPDARWIYVRDLPEKEIRDHAAYWMEMESWIARLGFHAVVPASRIFPEVDPRDADRVAYRSVFANPGEFLVLARGRVAPETLRSLDGKPVRWLFCGEVPAERPPNSHLLGWLPDPVMRAIASVCDRVIDEAFVLQNDWGIGDELLLSAVAREIRRAKPDLRISIRSRFGFRFPDNPEPPPEAIRVETIYQNPVLYGPERHAPFPGPLVQQMLDKFFVDTKIKVEAKDLRPEVVLPLGLKRDSRLVTVHSRPNPRLPSKDWGIERWMELCGILHRGGFRLRQVGAAEEPLLPHVEDRRGTLPGAIPDLVAESGAVVCLVGLLMHVAAATKTPAVVIYGGREHPAIDGYPDQVHLVSGPLSCKGRWGCHLAPDLECPHGMKCMEGITPERVAREVEGLVP